MKLPALRSLNQLVDQEPVIVVDTREQEPLVFKSLKSVRGTLLTGDYSVAGLEELCSVERKSISDPVSCCMGLNQNYFETPIGPAERIPRGSPKSKKAPNQNFVSIKTATRRR